MPEKENQAVNDFSHLSQYQMPKERRGGKRNRRRVRKREKETTLVGWKFLSVPLICKNLGSLLKAVDLHINDISVTEKEGAAALGRMSSALNQMLQVWFQLGFQCAQC